MLKSEAQRRWMQLNRPDLLPQLEQATPKGSKLPERAPPSSKPPLTSKAAFKPQKKHLSRRTSR
jgi:hypothetical protein